MICGMSRSTEARDVNLLATLATALSDRIRYATESAAGHTSAAPAALIALHEFLGGASIDDLRKAVSLTPSGAVRLVDRLEADGYVQRSPGTDGRSVSLKLTQTGRAAARRVQAARSDALSGILDELSQEERSSLTGLIEKLLPLIVSDRAAARERGNERSGGWLCRLCDFAACGRDQGECPVANTIASTSPKP
jgi:DNA-binding MarR family transcriptional regulator